MPRFEDLAAEGQALVEVGGAVVGVDVATQAELDGHATDTTDVHGIADTSLLETTAGAQAKADAAEAAANIYTDTAVDNATYVVRKAADETVNNTSTLQNDDELSFPIAANETWVGSVTVFATGNTTADIRFGMTGPAGSTIVSGSHGQRTADTLVESSTSSFHGADAAVRPYVFHFSVVNGATAGTMTFQFAQATATPADTTVKAGSFLEARKMA